MNAFRVIQIDHVELFVPDRHEAAEWYRQVLGLEVVAEFREWAEPDGGPLMIATSAGGTKLALFRGKPAGAASTGGFHRVAFRADAGGFLDFVRRVAELRLTDHRQRLVTPGSVVDHGKAHSIYFSDPYGHHLEITTYDHEKVRAALRASHGGTGTSLG